jgi:hypothetical protein
MDMRERASLAGAQSALRRRERMIRDLPTRRMTVAEYLAMPELRGNQHPHRRGPCRAIRYGVAVFYEPVPGAPSISMMQRPIFRVPAVMRRVEE